MYAAGIDVSTTLVAVVVLDFDGTLVQAREYKIPKQANKAERCRVVADTGFATALRRCGTVYVEQPMGTSIKGVAEVERIVGAVLAAVPNGSAVNLISPGAWKKLNRLNGNAGKPAIMALAKELYPGLEGYSQDICDASLIARAAVVESNRVIGVELPLSPSQERIAA